MTIGKKCEYHGTDAPVSTFNFFFFFLLGVKSEKIKNHSIQTLPTFSLPKRGNQILTRLEDLKRITITRHTHTQKPSRHTHTIP